MLCISVDNLLVSIQEHDYMYVCYFFVYGIVRVLLQLVPMVTRLLKDLTVMCHGHLIALDLNILSIQGRVLLSS